MVISFNIAQSFYVEPNLKENTKIKLSGFDLYFKYKPSATDNRSGINRPGITIYLADTIYGVPKITEATYTQFARAEWESINTSSDATVPTSFRFPSPIAVDAGKLYAMVISFDGNETFWPWVAKMGSWIVNSDRVIYTGQAGNVIGKYYEFVSTDTANDPTTAVNQTEYVSYWRPLNDTTLKFSVFAARYFIEGVPIINANLAPSVIVHSNNLIQTSDELWELDFIYPAQKMEYLTFDLANSDVKAFVGAQRVFQNTVFYPGGRYNGASFVTLSCNSTSTITANATHTNGAAFNWNTIFNNYTGMKFITLFDTDFVNIRMIQSIISNTMIQVSEPVTFSNNATKFMISPIATIDSMDVNSPRGKKTEFLMLTHSNANSTVRFVNNVIEAITIAPGAGGNGYNNSDILYIRGYENVPGKITGGYVAVGNVLTNSTGGIINVFLSNQGAGFTNSAAMVVVVSNSVSGNNTVNTSNGTNVTLTYSVGGTLKTELSDNTFKNCSVINLDLNDGTPYFDVFTPPGTTFDLGLRMQYYIQNDPTTSDGFVTYVYPGGQFFPNIQLMKRNRFKVDKVPVFVSHSNEYNTLYSNGSVNNLVDPLGVTSNAYMLDIHTTSNSDYVIVTVDTVPTIEFGKYIFNKDYTKEETDTGNCWAKHVVTRNTFARLSEDIRVYLEAYKPANTDIQVYVRIQNSGDPVAFDDEDWTRLALIDGTSVISSLSNESDYIELTYGFQQYPNTAFNLAGFVSTTNNSANITGSGTAFTTNLAVNDMVRIYDPYFPANNFIVATVTNVYNNTLLGIDQPMLTTINPALVQGGMKIDKLSFPHQAYLNITNDNVVRYYNTSIVKYDGYDTMQIKVLLMSDHLSYIPKIHTLRAVGVSA